MVSRVLTIGRNMMSIPRTGLDYPEWAKEGLAEM